MRIELKGPADIDIYSEALEHVVLDSSFLINVQQVAATSVELSNGKKTSSTLRGRIAINSVRAQVLIRGFYYIPDMRLTILSCTSLHEKGFKTTIAQDRLWHQTLVHADNRVMRTIFDSNNCVMVKMDKPSTQNSLSCVLTKLKGTKPTGKLIRHSKTASIHANICTYMKVLSHSENRYFLTTKAAKQRYKRVKFLKNRENV